MTSIVTARHRPHGPVGAGYDSSHDYRQNSCSHIAYGSKPHGDWCDPSIQGLLEGAFNVE